MSKSLSKLSPRLLIALVLGAGLGFVAGARADCARATHGKEALTVPVVEPKPEAAVSMTDPALDGVFARYADMHRDAVGYTVLDLSNAPIYAKAVPDTASSLTR